jgi:hypothetical protein
MSLTAPDFVTHYYRSSRGPFLNLSELSNDEVTEVMTALIAERRKGLQHRPFGRKYIAMRRAVEERLRSTFLKTGGNPERHSPHYFVLGESEWFRGLAVDMEEIRVPITALPTAQTTLTWGDSFAAMEVGTDFGLPAINRPYFGQVYRLEDIPDLVARYGIPRPRPISYDGLPTGEVPETFVEVQLWSDGPIREHLASRSS